MSKPLKRHAELEALFGSDFLPISKSAPPSSATASKSVAPEGKPSVATPAKGVAKEGPKIDHWQWPADYLALRQEALGCRKCGLCETRTQVVFGVGRLDSPLLFVGEAPGADEDIQGEPFVGKAGQLLTRTLAKHGVSRDKVHIANILKCRPPGNRTPAPEEMAACMPWLQRQLEAIRPKVLCAMGNIAAQTLLNTKTGITRLRGQYADGLGRKIFPTFHPAYILRNMGELPVFEADILQACRDAGLAS
ncbi:MAG TPA: uracil-DNA glycosylase [Planctomycetota bacterium]